MERISFLFATCLAFFLIIDRQPVSAQTSYQKTYSNGEYLVGNDIGFYNGFYYIAGASKTNTHSRLFVEKKSVSGDSIWAYCFNASISVEGRRIISRNGYLYVAANSYATSGITKGLLAKILENGEIVWSRSFGTDESQVFHDAMMPDDSTIVVVGVVTGTGAGQKDIIVSVFDTSGAVRWSKTYGTTANEQGNSIIKTTDTCFVIAGFTDFFDPSGDMLAMKISMSGTFQWAITFNIIHPGSGSTYFSDQSAADVMETLTHFLVVTGSTKTGEYTPTDQQWSPVILKLGLDGSLIWSHDYYVNSGNNKACQISETPDGSYVVLNSMSNRSSVMFKTNTSGNTEWCHYYRPGNVSGYNCSTSAMCLSNGAFVITGSRNSQVDTVLYLVKTNSAGLSGCYDFSLPGDPGTMNPAMNPVTLTSTDVTGNSNFQLIMQNMHTTPYILCELPTGIGTKEAAGTIYPNPVTDYLFLDRIAGITNYVLFDPSGKELATGDSKIIDFRNFRPGLYVLKLITVKETSSYKVIKTQY